jgi:hypothetical protein
MTTREKYAAAFGEEQTAAIEKAAEGHIAQGASSDRGSDAFKWALLVVIGFQCAERDGYREHHGITVPWVEVQAFMKAADLGSFDGGMPDVLAALCGVYNEYLKPREVAS